MWLRCLPHSKLLAGPLGVATSKINLVMPSTLAIAIASKLEERHPPATNSFATWARLHVGTGKTKEALVWQSAAFHSCMFATRYGIELSLSRMKTVCTAAQT
jgi:hypothetical protein